MDREAKGWGKGSDVYATGNEYSPTRQDLDPFTNSADNDALIEAWLGGDGYTLILSPITAEASVSTFNPYKITRFRKGIEQPYTTAKKNEAVCMAIYEAVTV